MVLIHALLSIAPLTLACSLFFILRRWRRNFPPGPLSLPFIGAALSMPLQHEWVTYEQWKVKYGPIVSAHVFGQRIILLNTPEVAGDLLGRQNEISSDRPAFPMFEMMNMIDWNLALMPYGSKWRQNRQLLGQAVSSQMLTQYRSIQQEEVSLLLGELLESPEHFFQHLRSLNTGQILRIFYGYRIDRNGVDKYVKLNDDGVIASSPAGSPARYLVNVFPIVRFWPSWLPGGGFQHDAQVGRDLVEKVQAASLELSQKSATDNVKSFLASELQNSPSPEHQATALNVATASYAAGVETSTSMILSFILAMVLYPDAQRRAHEEIDRVMSGRLPTLEDRDENRLPYVDAILTECYRWAPPAPFGLPHRLTKDASMLGYTLSRGSIVMSNIWSIMHDEKNFTSPMKFLPERFLEGKDVLDPRAHVYGYGRRVCPGRFLADGMLWLAIASILTVFNISPELNEEGHSILPDVTQYTSGVMSRPDNFRCLIIPRSSSAVDLIRSSVTNMCD